MIRRPRLQFHLPFPNQVLECAATFLCTFTRLAILFLAFLDELYVERLIPISSIFWPSQNYLKAMKFHLLGINLKGYIWLKNGVFIGSLIIYLPIYFYLKIKTSDEYELVLNWFIVLTFRNTIQMQLCMFIVFWFKQMLNWKFFKTKLLKRNKRIYNNKVINNY